MEAILQNSQKSEHELILVLDFGGQHNHLAARRVRDQHIYCEVHSHEICPDRIKTMAPAGIIFTGGDKKHLPDQGSLSQIFELGIPILGIGYGATIMAHLLGGTTTLGEQGGSGRADLVITAAANSNSAIFGGLPQSSVCWMNFDRIIGKVPEAAVITASTEGCPVAAFELPEKKFYGLQFHPEACQTEIGSSILHNFLYNICGCSGDWKMSEFARISVARLKEKIGDKKVLLALSGGVDSSVVAALISRAVGDNLTCIFVDHGLLRENEANEVVEAFSGNFELNFVRVDAQTRFLTRLKGVEDPEQKRKIIGEEFIRVFEEEASKIGHVSFFAQGTIYPDIIESGLDGSAVIKSHHNVGGLPEHVDFEEILEPLSDLFKDEVRLVGLELGLPAELVGRQPFPGPGLAVRVIGEITEEKLAILRPADAIFRRELEQAMPSLGADAHAAQYFAVLTNLKTVGVTAGIRSYEYVLALRAVNTADFMTAEWTKIPPTLLEKISNRISSEVPHINRIVYDITSKPPGTIEWE